MFFFLSLGKRVFSLSSLPFLLFLQGSSFFNCLSLPFSPSLSSFFVDTCASQVVLCISILLPLSTLQDPGQKNVATHKQQLHSRTNKQTTKHHTPHPHTKKNNTAMRIPHSFFFLPLSLSLFRPFFSMHCTGKICPTLLLSLISSPSFFSSFRLPFFLLFVMTKK